MLEIVDPLKRPLHNFMLNACYTKQFNDNNNNIKFIVEATKSEKKSSLCFAGKNT